MAKQSHAPRKQRTRQHVIADLSVHHVEGFVLAEGHTAQRLERDYGYDLLIVTFDERGYAEPGGILVQLKAAERLRSVGADYVFDLDVRDYRLWILERTPVILILYDTSAGEAFWLAVQSYFRGNQSRSPKKGAKTIRVRVPASQKVNRSAVAQMRELKNRGFSSAGGGVG